MKIITTVGTSLLTNYPVEHSFNDNDAWNGGLFSVNTQHDFDNLVKDLLKNANQYKTKASAEIASIDKIDPSGGADIYLICTETVLSVACGKALGNYFGDRVKEEIPINGLQVKNFERFKKEGVVNLLNKLENIAQGGYYWDDCVLNITGGYKAVIPIMTIVGHLKKIPIYYLFEEGSTNKNELIEIPKMPIDYKMDVFDTYWEEFSKFGNNSDEIVNRNELTENFINDCAGCFEIAQGDFVLNPVGKILWWNYRSDYKLVFSTEETWKEIQAQKDIKRIIETKFCNSEIRSNKTELKQDHYVFDDGNNDNRIYYFEDNGNLFIYKTFENEEKAKEYISIPFTEQNRQNFIKKSKPFRIKIKKY